MRRLQEWQMWALGAGALLAFMGGLFVVLSSATNAGTERGVSAAAASGTVDASAHDCPGEPAELDGALDERCAGPVGCPTVARQRADYLASVYPPAPGRCPAPPADRAFRHFAQTLDVFKELPVGTERAEFYARLEHLAPALPWGREVDCNELFAFYVLSAQVPSAVPGVMAKLARAKGLRALDEACADGPPGTVRVPTGFASFLASEPERFEHMLAVERSAAPEVVPSPAAVDPTERHVIVHGDLRIGTKMAAGDLALDTGSPYVVITPALAADLRAKIYRVGTGVSPCMGCASTSLAFSWLDAVRIGGVTVSNVPVLVAEHPVEGVIGLSFLRAAGGLTIQWTPTAANIRVGPPTACSKEVPTAVGPQGELWVRASLGDRGGTPWLLFDTGADRDYLLMDDVLRTIPADWQPRESAAPSSPTWIAPDMPSPLGTHPAPREVGRVVRGGPRDVFKGSGGYVSHLAFRPMTTCIDFNPPALSVAP